MENANVVWLHLLYRHVWSRYPVISAFRDLGLSDLGLFRWLRPVISAYAAVISACAVVISACFLWPRPVISAYAPVISACGAVISACIRWTRPVTPAYEAVISVYEAVISACAVVILAYIHMMLPSIFVQHTTKYRKFYAVYDIAWLIRLVFISGLCFITVFILYSSDGPAGRVPHTTLNPRVLDIGH